MRRRPTQTTIATALGVLLAGLGAGLAPLATASGDGTAGIRQASATTAYRFVAAPDIFNQDIGDVRGQAGWQPGDPNSWTPQLDAAVDTVLDEIAGQHPRSLLVAGDLVEGHWGRDDMGTGIFGPTGTVAERAANLRRAGEFYHGQNAQRFAAHGLDLYPAVGDHDLGDNPWDGTSARLRFKRHHAGLFRSVFAQAYDTARFANRPFGTQWQDTAYATQLSPDILLVSLDVFHVTRSGVRNEVVGGQLAWLEGVLADARERGVPWVVVQGHVPVLEPVRVRNSSGLSLLGGEDSPLWRTLSRYGVDLYLCGEVHDTSMRQAGGVTQIATGTPIYLRRASYLTADVYADRMDLTVHEFAGVLTSAHPIWQGSNLKTQGDLSYPSASSVVATMTLTAAGQAVAPTGKLAPYAG
ncbi:metallophosphoesterase family protein [Nocardioides sp. HB32]